MKKHQQKCGKLKTQLSACTSSKNNEKQRHPCKHCGIPFNNYKSLYQHVTVNHPLNQTGGDIHQPFSEASIQEPAKKREKD